MHYLQTLSLRTWALVVLALVGLQITVLYFLGQPLFFEGGAIRLWANNPLSPENSQQFFDWYTFSHIVHGFIFYWALKYFFPQMPLRMRLAAAVGVEVGWEILENTPWLIEHYRQQALAQGYAGDSILNSTMDTLSMIAGFVFAWKVPWWVALVVAVVFEGFVLYMIRDSLVLNVINLVFPFESISAWQSGA